MIREYWQHFEKYFLFPYVPKTLREIYQRAVARQCYQENPGFTEVPPWRFEPGSFVTGSKWVVHWTSETW